MECDLPPAPMLNRSPRIHVRTRPQPANMSLAPALQPEAGLYPNPNPRPLVPSLTVPTSASTKPLTWAGLRGVACACSKVASKAIAYAVFSESDHDCIRVSRSYVGNGAGLWRDSATAPTSTSTILGATLPLSPLCETDALSSRRRMLMASTVATELIASSLANATPTRAAIAGTHTTILLRIVPSPWKRELRRRRGKSAWITRSGVI